MMKIKLSEWQDESGYWHAADVSAVGQGSSDWWRVPRALGMDLAAYAELIITKYKPDKVIYSNEKCILICYWKSQAAMRKYKNDTNAMLRRAGAQ